MWLSHVSRRFCNTFLLRRAIFTVGEPAITHSGIPNHCVPTLFSLEFFFPFLSLPLKFILIPV